ncbi:MAG: hypothetical protein ACR2IH_03395 [Pyrinomonadaceae bacterium]
MLRKQDHIRIGALFAVILVVAGSSAAQAKGRRSVTPKPTPSPVAVDRNPSSPEITPVDTAGTPVKKNGRPTKNTPQEPAADPFEPIYTYQFDHPNFLIKRVLILHDELGRGTISFVKLGSSETVTDPIQLSASTLEKLRSLFAMLHFLDSTEDYQSKKDFKHLGEMSITVKKDRRERVAKFNWSENKDASELANVYRKIGNQFIWIFDVNVARENQPLQSPALFDELDALFRRDELADAEQMIPFLKQIETDERVPLIGRNHATKIIAAIQKQSAKNRK